MVDAVVSDQVVVDDGADYLGRLFDLLFRVLADYLRDSPVLLAHIWRSVCHSSNLNYSSRAV